MKIDDLILFVKRNDKCRGDYRKGTEIYWTEREWASLIRYMKRCNCKFHDRNLFLNARHFKL